MKKLICIYLFLIIGMFMSLYSPTDIEVRCSSTVWDIIEQVIKNPRVIFEGDFRERHRYAKGVSTRFGRLSFDSDRAIRVGCNIGNVQLHKIGYALGYSNKWSGYGRR